MKIPELVLPAGDGERGRIAFSYGADAVYLGLPEFSMRKTEVRFTLREIGEIIEFAHKKKKKVYVTFNIFPHEKDLKNLHLIMSEVARIEPDAFIIGDLGLIRAIRQISPSVPLHISTQANVTNSETVKFWRDFGAKRIVLARELTLEEIRVIHRSVPEVELEVFVHGAMCISFSGRCLLSAYMTGREANLGECAQPCRWSYRFGYLEENQRKGEFFPVEESSEGTTIMSSQDLRLIRYLPELAEAGVSAFKIEGRNKTEYYVATTALAYSQALKLIRNNKLTDGKKLELEAELEKLNYRGYTEGFLFGACQEGGTYDKREPIRKWNYCGKVIESRGESHLALIKNQLVKADLVELLTPQGIFKDIVKKIIVDGQEVEKINPGRQNQRAEIKFSRSYQVDSMIRKMA